MLELNKIYNQNCLEGMKQLEDESIDMILTDPPYGIDFLSSRTKHQKKIVNDSFDNWEKNVDLWLDEFFRLIRNTGVVCCFSGGGGKLPVSQLFTLKAIAKKFKLIQTVIWDKKTIGLGWHYRPSYETIIILSKSEQHYAFYSNTKDISNIIRINNIIPQEGEHPTPKPEKLMRFFIKLHSKPGDLVLDPFAGGGSSMVAAKQLNRNFIGFEIINKYYDIANKRLQQSILTEVFKCQ